MRKYSIKNIKGAINIYIIYVEEDKSRMSLEVQANAQWITQNTKPCPQCRCVCVCMYVCTFMVLISLSLLPSAPIQKNEGCNHMNCKKVS